MAYVVTQASASFTDGTATVVATDREHTTPTKVQITFPFEFPAGETPAAKAIILRAQEILKEVAESIRFPRL
jgi:hypothetical protein